MAAELPRAFGPYALLSVVGRGGMGEVYLAKTGGLAGYEKHCVVKTLRPEVAAESEYVQRFSEEARVVVQLAHRNICNVFDVGRAEGSLYVAMEHVAGRDLRQLARAERLPIPVALYIITEVLEALDYAHRFVDGTTGEPLALVHRDVSPQNILLGVEGDVKLIDFGVATSTRLGPITQSGTVLGKLNYMAPEHARGEEVDGRADQWSTAVVLVELLLGAGFYGDLDRTVAWGHSGKGTYRPEGFSSIETGLRQILERALSPTRDDRFPSCTAFAHALVAWARQSGNLADCRDVRSLLSQRFGDLASEARHVYQTFADVTPPSLQEATPAASPWESIATTMMVAPPTTGIGLEGPGTMVVRDRGRSPVIAPQPARADRRAVALAAAAGGGLALLGVLAISTLTADAPDASVVIAHASADAGLVDPGPPAKATGDGAPAADDVAAAPDAGVPSANAAGDAVDADDDEAAGSPRARRTTAVKQKFRYDAATRSNLAFLAAGCVAKVPCAKNILDWSKRARLDAERVEVSDAAASCARSCRLK